MSKSCCCEKDKDNLEVCENKSNEGCTVVNTRMVMAVCDVLMVLATALMRPLVFF